MYSISSILGVPEKGGERGVGGAKRREQEDANRRAEMELLATLTAEEAALHLNRRCPHCGDLLTPYKFERFGWGVGMWRYHDQHDCPEERAAAIAQDARSVQARRDALTERLQQAGLTGDLAGATFASFSPRANFREGASVKDRVANYAANLAALGSKNWLVLWGSYGMGKSHLAAAVVRQLLEQGQHSAFFRVWPEYLQRLKLSWSTRDSATGERESDIVGELARGWLVVLDDLDKVNPTAWQQEQLFTVINGRLLSGLPTIITCNTRPGPELARVVGGATCDRIIGKSWESLGMTGISFRSGARL